MRLSPLRSVLPLLSFAVISACADDSHRPLGSSASALGPGAVIDWCGNGIDEDGDGHDRPCGQAPSPGSIVRTVEIVTAGGSRWIDVAGDVVATSGPPSTNPRYSVAYPRGGYPALKVVNASDYPVTIGGPEGGTLRGHRAGQVDDETTLLLGPPAHVTFSVDGTGPMDMVSVTLAFGGPPAPATPLQGARFAGTATGQGRTYDAELLVVPEIGAACPADQANRVASVDDCAATADCGMNVRLELTLRDPSSGGPARTYPFLPQQCDGAERTHRTLLSYSPTELDISAYEYDFTQFERRLLVDGTPGRLTGSTKMLDETPNADVTLDLHAVAPVDAH